ncbi:hypothetical protein OIU78_026265 [Salix suchowensis]|nr:hypothetical protein OIU78_026265 [Salix suchowensis]
MGTGTFKTVEELSEMVDSVKSLFLSNVFHASCVGGVDKAGMVAAASTAPRLIGQSHPLNPSSFIADHPFFDLDQGDESGMIFFIGFLQPFSLMQPFIAIVLEPEKIDDGAAAAATVLQNSESIVGREKRSKWTSTAVPLSSVFKSARVIILLNQYFILPRNDRASL